MLKAQFDITTEIRKLKQAAFSKAHKAVKVFEYHAEIAVNQARTQGSYKDRTGNLRHSIAWRVEDKLNRQLKLFVENYSDEVKQAVNQSFDEAKQLHKDINLTIVAGMMYARFVEDKGYDVLTVFLPDKSELQNDLKRVLK